LDHTDEVNLNKLEAARRKNKDRERERQRNNKDERHCLHELIDNGEQLDHADEVN
jgi:hypothetical protein